jgi:peptide/nickel transport system permease protein
MKRVNAPLAVGGIILLLLYIMSVFPTLFTDSSPYSMNRLRSWIDTEGKLQFQLAPFPPGEEYPLGTDALGRDLHARIIHGTRLSLSLGLIIAMLRMAIALPLAIAGGFGARGPRLLIRQFSLIFTAVPTLLISMAVLNQQLFQSLEKGASIIAFAAVLTLVDWAKLSSALMERCEEIISRPYISGVLMLGKSRRRTGIENMFPHLLPEILVLLSMEVARVLTLLLQLGVFTIFVGNLRIIASTDNGRISYVPVSFEPEWASMLGTARSQLASSPWTVIIPAVAFFIAILAFNLFGEGLRRFFGVAGHGILSDIRRMLSGRFDRVSPRTRRRSILLLLISLLLIMLPILSERISAPVLPIPGQSEISADLLPQAPVDYRSAGQAALVSRTIEALRDAGFQSINGGGYAIETEADESAVLLSSRLSIAGLPLPGELEYRVEKGAPGTVAGTLIDARFLDLISPEQPERLTDSVLIIDLLAYEHIDIDQLTHRLQANFGISGVILIDDSLAGDTGRIVEYRPGYFQLRCVREGIDLLTPFEGKRIELLSTFQAPASPPVQILARSPEASGVRREKALLLLFPLEYENEAERENFSLILSALPALYQSSGGKAMIIAFVGAGTHPEFSGLALLSENLGYDPSDIEAAVDMSRIFSGTSGDFLYSDAQAPFTRQYAWNLSKLFKDELKRAGIEAITMPTETQVGESLIAGFPPANHFYWKRGVAVLHMAGAGANRDFRSVFSALIRSIRRNNL